MFNNKEIKNYFNKSIRGKYADRYEFNRWFRVPRTWLDYSMTYRAIEHALKNENFNRVLEVGPGPGTWTRLLYRRNPEACFTLVDISEEMKRQFELEMRAKPNIEYIIKDIAYFDPPANSYDLIFSSRTVEYFEDKKAIFQKLFRALAPGGRGIIITKNPCWGLWFQKKRNRFQHTRQISIPQMRSLLESVGFKEIVFYPATVRVPIIDRFALALSGRIFNKIFERPAGDNKNFLLESYLIRFRK